MTMKTEPLPIAIAAALLTLFAWWLGGFDFNERGGAAVFVLFSTLLAFGFAYAWTKQ